MKKSTLYAVLMAAILIIGLSVSGWAQISISTDAALTENFNTLASTGTTNSTLPSGWLLFETGTNANTTYAADNGALNSGNTYSYGTTSSTERAFGGLQSGSLIPTIGVAYTNNSGFTITALSISYTGEQWRLGATRSAGIYDSLNFQYSLNATSLNTGTWTRVKQLDFASPINTGTAGALDGNNAANRSTKSFTISGLNIANGSTFYLKFTDYNVTSSDDGMAIDDWSLIPTFNKIDWANLQWPASGTITLGDGYTVYAMVYEPGITDAPGQGAGITAEIGYSTSNTDPATWTNWVPATYNAGFIDASNDEYMADLGAALAAAPVAPGTYYYACRFKLGTGAYQYGGFQSGFWNGTTNLSGVLTVNPPPQIEWCNLQWPASGTILEGGDFNVYAQVWKDGVTANAGPDANMQAWIGYSSTNSNPNTTDWTWVPATYNAFCSCGNNDEYYANLGAVLPAGDYYYASRFKYGLADFVYGGYNSGGGHFWDGTNYISGSLSIKAPVITVQPNYLSGFTYYIGNGPSAEQYFSVKGSDLMNNITLAAPADYEISLTSGTGFSNTLVLSEADGIVDSTAVFVRLKAGLPIADYVAEIITVSASHFGSGDQLVELDGSVTAPPLPFVTLNPTELTGIDYVFRRGPSTAHSFKVSGINMVDTLQVQVNPVSNFEISKYPTALYTDLLKFMHTAGTLSPKTVYVRLKAGLPQGTYVDSAMVTTLDGDTNYLKLTGTVLPPPPPSITVTPTSISNLDNVTGTGPSFPQQITVSGSDLLGPLTFTLSTSDFEISLNPASGYANSISITPVDGTIPPTFVYVRLKDHIDIEFYTATIGITSTGLTTVLIPVSGSTTLPIPTLAATPSALTLFEYVIDKGPSASQKITISGTNLTGNLVVTPPADYEISMVDGAGDVLPIVFTPQGGVVLPTTLYVRLKAGLPGGDYNNETISVTSAGAVTRNIVCNGRVRVPVITVSAASLAFADQVVNTVSAENSFTVSGDNIVDAITVTPPDGFKISTTSGSGYSAAPVVLTAVSGVVAPKAIYVVFSPTVVQAYTGNIVNASTAAVTMNVAVTGKGVCPSAGLPFAEEFDYPVGSLLTANCWNAHSGVGTNSEKVTAASITYPGYLSSGIGNEVSMATTGEDVNRIFAPQTSGSTYISMLVNVQSATTTGDYFFHVGQTVIGTTFRGRLFIKKDASDKLAFGISQTTTGAAYTPFSYSLNTTYLVVMKYTIVDGASNDVSAIYVNPALNADVPATGWITSTDAAGTDLTDLGAISLRQGSSLNAATLKVDGIRVATKWSDIVGVAGTAPAIAATPATLNGFTYMQGNGPSAEQSFTASGVNLTANISIVPSADYEISTGTGAAFAATNPLVLTQTGGTVANTNVYVRLKAGLTAGDFNNEVINLTSAGAIAKTVTCSGTVTVPVPTIEAGTLVAFGNQPVNTNSAEQSYVVKGLNLTSGITVTPPDGFLISLTSGTGYSSTPIVLPATGGTVAPTTIYVVFHPTALQAYAGNISHESAGVTTILVPVSGKGICAPAAFPFVENFDYTAGSVLTANCWNAHSAEGTNPVTVAAGTITYPGYLSSGIGNEVIVTGSGEDANRNFDPQGLGTYYFSCLANVQSATTTGEYFMHLGQSVIGTTFRGRVFVKANESGKIAFGVSMSSSGANYTGFDYDLNTTYLVVLKFSMLEGDANDVASIIVNPVLNQPEPETGWVANTDASGTDFTELGSVALRQGNAANAATLRLDGIRGSKKWSDIAGVVDNIAPAENALADAYSYEKTIYVTVKDNSKGTVSVYSTDGKLLRQQSAVQGLSKIRMDVPGIYLVKIQTMKSFLTRKVWIQ